MVQRGRAPARLAAVSQTPGADRRLVIVESPAKVNPLSGMILSSLHPICDICLCCDRPNCSGSRYGNAQARTIQQFLPEDYVVDFCLGHVRDLAKRTDLSSEVKKTEFGATGIDVHNGFTPIYVEV